ncbi:MAG: alpha/beta fold hydrolase [Thiolinea sp.]
MSKTLYFAHATGFPGLTYSPLFDALQEQGFTVDYIDKIGHHPEYPITNNWPYLVKELEAQITANHQQAVIGIGHSAGGLLHYQLAQKRPDLYSHLVLLDPPIINGWQNIIWWLAKRLKLTDHITPAGSSKKRRTHFEDYDQAYRHLRHKALFKNFTEASFLAYLEHGLTEDDSGRLTLIYEKDKEVALFRTAADNLWRYKTPLQLPGLYLTAEDSEFASRPFAQRLAQQNGMKYQVLKGGHLFPQEDPHGTAEVIAAWLLENQTA